jgi:RNA polymerase sigma factor (TIGR02999 family)
LAQSGIVPAHTRVKLLASGKSVDALYMELRHLAAWYLRNERTGHTLQPTALVNEACLRLMQRDGMHAGNRLYLFNLAAKEMRRVLIDYARRRRAGKRGQQVQVQLMDSDAPAKTDVQLDDLVHAMAVLERFDSNLLRVVELRFFGGLTVEETAAVLGTSPATVKREWHVARLWLYRQMTGANPE